MINKAKTALKEWKTGWKEKYDYQGEELEIENHIERQPKVFINDKKISINVQDFNTIRSFEQYRG